MTRPFAWKPRWAMIMLVNSFARSTFDISRAPLVTSDCAPESANPSTGLPGMTPNLAHGLGLRVQRGLAPRVGGAREVDDETVRRVDEARLVLCLTAGLDADGDPVGQAVDAE